MDSERHGVIGALAAHRPLLISVVFAFGLTALSVVGFASASAGQQVARFAIDILFGLSIPVVLVSLAPTTPIRRLLFALMLGGALFGVTRLAHAYSPGVVRAILPSSASIIVGSVLIILLSQLRPVIGQITALTVAAPFAAMLGTLGAIGFVGLNIEPSLEIVAVVACLGLSLACLIGVGVSADFTHGFAHGAEMHDAAGRAAYLGISFCVYALFICIVIFGVSRTMGTAALDWSWREIFYTGGGIVLATVTVLLLTAASLSLKDPDEKIAVIENQRGQNFRDWWRYIRRVLPASSALAAFAMLLIFSVVAIFTASHAPSVSSIIFICVSGIGAGVVFVSLRTGLFVFSALFISTIIVNWGIEIIRGAAPEPMALLTAQICVALLYAQIGVAWRDSINPWRKARETTGHAMTQGAHRYIVSTLLSVAAMVICQTSGLWSGGGVAAAYLFGQAVIGFIIAPPLMTSISAAFGK